MKRVLAGLTAAGIALLAAGCASSSASSDSGSKPAAQVTLRLGFLENITHASALVGVKEGFFTKNLGKNVTLKLYPFSTGTEEATALLAGQLDAAYVGPNPAIKAWQQSSGSLIKVISGAASGGAELVVKSGITSAAQLKGQKLASPSLGNTQDVSMRYWLKQQGLTTTSTGGGDVPITPITPNSDAVLAFESGQIAGGWEPAPYDAEMIADGGHALVNEASLWPNGQFVTTELVATQSFIAKNPTVISDLLKGQIEANSFIADSKSAAETAANAELAALSGKSLKSPILAAAFAQVTFTNDPIASSLITDANHAVSVGLLNPVKNLSGIYDLGPLNKLLAAAGQAQVSS
ncbi:MAG TPA: ABC transporter substrate-binding protein [Streptosporangiaceae bacterium]|jgi:NitT/TauT family transport system substrate-binding protein|nr:ABC transporter substrate-binding protein [Streptosporangiaceae bacterium]